MSWLDQVKSDFIITTGDGKQYRPLWLNSVKSTEYNVVEFEFPNVAGTLVNRSQPKGSKYNLEIYFQGDNCIVDALAFEKSANDPRAWVITHPYYGNITVQPTSLSFDNTQYNVSKVTGSIIETITSEYPKTSVDPVDRINDDKNNLDETFISGFDTTPSVSDKNLMKANTNSLYTSGAKVVSDPTQAEKYFNSFNTANAAITNATSQPLQAMRAMQAVINAPALFQISAQQRIDTLTTQFNTLRSSMATIINRSTKKIYENNGGAIISAQAQAAATPLATDYPTKNSVLRIAGTLVGNYNTYINDLDILQTPNGGDVTSYIPDANSLIALNEIINFAVANLFNIASGAKQERSVLLEDDNNVVVLTHRFYGLDIDDKMIDRFISTNKIGLNEMLQIRKGRKVVWYI